MYMKKTLKFLLPFALFAILFAAETNFVSRNKQSIEKVEAATTYRYYFSPDSTWSKDSATFQIDFRNDSGDWIGKRFKMNKLDNTISQRFTDKDIYYYDSDTLYKKIYFGRFSENGEKEWNYSGLLNPTGARWFVKTSNADSNWTDNAGTWSNFDVRYKTTDQTIDSSTGRFFVFNSDTSWSGDGSIAVRAWGKSAGTFNGIDVSASIYFCSWFEDEGANCWYGYADVPYDIDGFQFVLMSGAEYSSSIWNYQKNDSFAVSDSMFSGIYYASAGTAREETTFSFGGAHSDKAGAPLLQKMFDRYFSCSTCVYNGYKRANDLYDKVYIHAVDGATSTLIEDGNYTVEEKMYRMLKMNENLSTKLFLGINNIFAEITNGSSNNPTLIIVISAVVTGLAVGGYFLLRRKKED